MPPETPANAAQTNLAAALAQSPPPVATGDTAKDQRVADAVKALAEADTQPAPDGTPETPPPPSGEAAPAATADDANKPAEPPPGEAPPPKPPEPAESEKRVRNQQRDLNSEAARVRKHFELADKRHAEADKREQELLAREQSYREIATLLGPNGNAIGAAERLAKAQGIKLSEFVERLNRQLIAEEQGRPAAGSDATAREVAELRAELKAEREARTRAESEAQQRQHYATWHKEETAKHVSIAASPEWGSDFPNLNALPAAVREEEIANGIAVFASNPETRNMPRLEVLAAIDKHVENVRARYGQASPPAAPAGKGQDGKPPAQRANGTDATGNGKRTVPTNGDAASGSGARRRLTAEERRKEAAKVL